MVDVNERGHIFAMITLVYNYSGNPITNNDQGIQDGFKVNNNESYCIHNPWTDSQSNGNYVYLSAYSGF